MGGRLPTVADKEYAFRRTILARRVRQVQHFSYHKAGMALKTSILMLLVLLIGDVVVVFVLSMVLPGPWNWAVLGAGMAMTAYAVWFLTRPLRTQHHLTDTALELHFGRFGLAVPREAIIRAGRAVSPVPREITVPTRSPAYHV